MRDLPLSLLLEGDVRLSHGTPDNDLAYCLETVLPGFGESGSPGVRPATPEEVQSRLGAVRHSLVLCGHTHVPRMAQREGTLIVNPGSVGLQAYDDPHPYLHIIENGTPHARYAVIERRPAGWLVDLAMAAPAQTATVQPGTGEEVPGVAPQGNANAGETQPEPAELPPKRSPVHHYLWAVLIARICIYEVFPLLCPMCGGQMRLIAFITEGAEVRKILNHIGVDSEPPSIAPARGPALWQDCDAQMGEGVQIEPDWDLAAQAAPDYEVDQRINW